MGVRMCARARARCVEQHYSRRALRFYTVVPFVGRDGCEVAGSPFGLCDPCVRVSECPVCPVVSFYRNQLRYPTQDPTRALEVPCVEPPDGE